MDFGQPTQARGWSRRTNQDRMRGRGVLTPGDREARAFRQIVVNGAPERASSPSGSVGIMQDHGAIVATNMATP